jgi:hypothetical protein
MGKAPFKLLFRGSPVLTQEGDNHKQQNSKSSQNTGAGPHPNNVLKPKTNKEFSAWAEYMGEEKDEAFIKWKKNMVGDGQDSQKK